LIEIIIFGSVITLFLIFGFLFRLGRGAFLIAGYNTMPQEERAKINEGALLKTMGNLMFGLSFTMTFWLLSSLLAIEWLLYAGIALFIGLTIGTIIRVNTHKKYKNID